MQKVSSLEIRTQNVSAASRSFLAAHWGKETRPLDVGISAALDNAVSAECHRGSSNPRGVQGCGHSMPLTHSWVEEPDVWGVGRWTLVE